MAAPATRCHRISEIWSVSWSIPAPVSPETPALSPSRKSDLPHILISSPVNATISDVCSSESKSTRRSASWARAWARATPSRSISSVATRNPAVSRNVTGSPRKSIRTSITSRVVPAISDVIAASRPASAFKSVDFPAFGAPMIATSNPSRMRSAIRLPSISRPMSPRTPDNRATTSGPTSTGTSSSAKSIVTSKSDAARIRSRRQRSASPPRAPENILCAWRRCASVSASISAPSPSTWVRSIRSFIRARRVNSPGSAIRVSRKLARCPRTAPTIAGLPCRCSSATASPVNDAPGSNHKTNPRSTRPPSILRSLSTARRGSGASTPKAASAAFAPGPDIRTTATPARPLAEVSAKIVSI